jgi:hypothetical protein
MKCSLHLIRSRLARRLAAMSLIETLVVTATSGILFAALASMSLFGARSFVALGNYSDLDKASRLALDKMSSEIRQTRGLTAFATNQLTFTDYDSGPLTYSWNPANGLLTRQKNGETTLLLAQCDYLSFQISQRNPSNNFSFYAVGASNVSQAKLVNVSWRCSRQILGAKINTESVQTAKIVIRN